MCVIKASSLYTCNDTICPRSSDPFYIVNFLYKMGHYFLDTHYFQEHQKLHWKKHKKLCNYMKAASQEVDQFRLKLQLLYVQEVVTQFI